MTYVFIKSTKNQKIKEVIIFIIRGLLKKKKKLRIKSTFKKNNKLLGFRECYVIVFQLGHDTLLVVNLRG